MVGDHNGIIYIGIFKYLAITAYHLTTNLDKTCWDKSWKSSKFKKWLNFSNSKFSPLPPNINVDSGQVLLPKA